MSNDERAQALRTFLGDERGRELSALAFSLVKANRLSTEEAMYLSLCLDGFADLVGFEEEVYAEDMKEMWRRNEKTTERSSEWR